MGLLRMAARTAVVAGTATAVHGRVQRRQAAKYDEQDQQQYAQEPQDAQQAPPAPEDDATAQLQNLAALHTQGVLTDEEFAAAKAKILGISTDAEAQRGTSLSSRSSATRSSSNTSPHDGDSPFRMGRLGVRWVQARGMSPGRLLRARSFGYPPPGADEASHNASGWTALCSPAMPGRFHFRRA